jgi:uncharacterized protein YggU (UPF0235/DUF167 family)
MNTSAPWPFIVWLDDGCRLDISVVTNAKRSEAAGMHDGSLRVRLAARPIDGAANEALRQWLAHSLQVAPSRITLIRGQTARRKQWQVQASKTQIEAWLARLTL